VASSTALVTTNLLWIGIASFLLFGDRPSRLMAVGIVISLSGSLLIFWSDSREQRPRQQSPARQLPRHRRQLVLLGLSADRPPPARQPAATGLCLAGLRQRRDFSAARLPGQRHAADRL
jgi:drug/metabolite transporter (DMT)-like permease